MSNPTRAKKQRAPDVGSGWQPDPTETPIDPAKVQRPGGTAALPPLTDAQRMSLMFELRRLHEALVHEAEICEGMVRGMQDQNVDMGNIRSHFYFKGEQWRGLVRTFDSIIGGLRREGVAIDDKLVYKPQEEW